MHVVVVKIDPAVDISLTIMDDMVAPYVTVFFSIGVQKLNSFNYLDISCQHVRKKIVEVIFVIIAILDNMSGRARSK